MQPTEDYFKGYEDGFGRGYTLAMKEILTAIREDGDKIPDFAEQHDGLRHF